MRLSVLLCCLIILVALAGCNRTPPPQAISTEETPPPALQASNLTASTKPHFYNRVMTLCIGINKYRSGGIPEVMFAESDAKTVAEKLQDLYSYEPILLLGAQASKKAILEKLDECDRQLGERDALLVFFAGHGQVIDLPSYARAGYLLPQDANLELNEKTDHERWATEAIDMQKFVERVGKMKAQHVVVVADACCTGFMTKRGNLEDRADLQIILKNPSRAVLAATTEKQPASEDKAKQHGYFTTAFLNHLAELSKNQDAGSVTDVFVEVRRQVARDSNKQMTPQMGRVGDGDGEFVFLPRSIPSTEVTAVLDTGSAEGQPEATRGRALLGVQDRARRRAKHRTQFSDLVEAFEALDYRYSTQPGQLTTVWDAKLKRFQENAANGEPLAMAALYYCYTKGLGAEKDPAEAGKWARKAYETGHPAGMHVFGEALHDGCGIPVNLPASEVLIRNALTANFPLSHFLYGDLLLRRFAAKVRCLIAADMPPDAVPAPIFDELQKASDAGIQTARLAIADAYLIQSARVDGLERTKTVNKALENLHPDDDKNIPLIQFELYRLYTWDRYHLWEPYYPILRYIKRHPEDIPRAKRQLEYAAQAGLPAAQAALANELSEQKYLLPMTRALSLTPDKEAAFKWASLAAKAGNMDAHLMLACMYNNGYGTLKDEAKAREHCEIAIKANYAFAYLNKGYWLSVEGVKDGGLNPPSYPLSVDPTPWWTRAGELGEPTGFYWAARRFRRLIEAKRYTSNYAHGYSQAAHYLVQGAKMGDKLCRDALLDKWWWWTGAGVKQLEKEYPDSAKYLRTSQEEGKIPPP